MAKKVIRLTERELINIVRRTAKQMLREGFGMEDSAKPLYRAANYVSDHGEGYRVIWRDEMEYKTPEEAYDVAIHHLAKNRRWTIKDRVAAVVEKYPYGQNNIIDEYQKIVDYEEYPEECKPEDKWKINESIRRSIRRYLR